MREAGADEQAAALADRAAAHAPLDDPGGVASMLDSLREAGADEQAAALLTRDPAAHVALDSPGSVATLLGSLREAGADEQAAALLARDPAAHVALDGLDGLASLLDSLREAGADEQAAALLARDRAAHGRDVASLLDWLEEASVPGQVPEPGGFATVDANLREQGRRPGSAHHLLEDLGQCPGAGAARQEPSGELAVPGQPCRAGRRGGGAEGAQLHDGPGGRVEPAGQAVDRPERRGLAPADAIAAHGDGLTRSAPAPHRA